MQIRRLDNRQRANGATADIGRWLAVQLGFELGRVGIGQRGPRRDDLKYAGRQAGLHHGSGQTVRAGLAARPDDHHLHRRLPVVEPVEQTGDAERGFQPMTAEGGDDALGVARPFCAPGQVVKPRQYRQHGAVAGRVGIVDIGFAPWYHGRNRACRYAVKAAAFNVQVGFCGLAHQRGCALQIGFAPGCLIKGNASAGEAGIIA